MGPSERLGAAARASAAADPTPLPLLVLLFLVLVTAPGGTRGCATVMLGGVGRGTAYERAVSGRGMDFGSGNPNRWVYGAAKKGTVMYRIALRPGSDNLTVANAPEASKHTFVCISTNTEEGAVKLAAASAAQGGSMNSSAVLDRWLGVCVDGLNTQGLGVSLLWQRQSAGYHNVTPSMTAADAMSWFDFPSWTMAQFATIAELKAALVGTPDDKLDKTACPGGGNRITSVKLTRSALVDDIANGATARHVQVHFAFYDKTGEMAAIEMVKTPGNACWYNITDLGTLTNDPQLFTQRKELERNMRRLRYRGPDRQWRYLAPASTVLEGGKPVDNRFTRLHLTRHQVKDQRFPDPKGNLSAFPNWDHSPAFTSDEKQAAIAQALEIVQSVALVAAVPIGLHVHPYGSSTHYTVVRDHTDADMYIRTSGSRTLRRISVADVEAGLETKGVQVQHAALHDVSPTAAYFEDRTDALLNGKLTAGLEWWAGQGPMGCCNWMGDESKTIDPIQRPAGLDHLG